MRDTFFTVDGEQIVPLYDPPHLIKGIRNNLLSKNLVWHRAVDGSVLTSKWKHIENAYKIDSASGDIRSIPKITEFHVNREKIKKMKVSYCTQVFRQSMAAAIAVQARNYETSIEGITMEKSGKDTSQIIGFFDNLFDSVNGGTIFAHPCKELRCAVNSRSQHVQFWRIAKNELKCMYFQREGGDEKFFPPSLKNWIQTLNGFLLVWKIL